MNRADPHTATHAKSPGKSHWSRWKRPLTMLFFLMLIVLFTMLAQRLEWNEVFDNLADFKVRTLIIASGLTLVSFLVYACFDLIGRTYIRQNLTWKQILPVGIISYAFNLNLSAWVGGIAMRYRLYSRLGVSKSNIAKILGLSLATNWFGYMVIAGAVFSSGLVRMPPGWKLSSSTLQGVGVLLLLLSAGYLAACRFARRREWAIRGIEIDLPSLRMAVLQLALGALNWSLMAAVIFTLLPSKLDYPLVLGVLLISAIAGVITHIPAGLGVLEAVFVALLQHEASRGSLVAGLLAYRAIYFILPLLITLVMYLLVEAKAKALRIEKNPSDFVLVVKTPSRAHRKSPGLNNAQPLPHHHLGNPADKDRGVGLLRNRVAQRVIGTIDDAMGQRVSLLARRAVTHDRRMGHIVVGLGLHQQDIPGELRAGMQGAIAVGTHQGASVITQVQLVQIAFRRVPLLVAIQRRHPQRQPANRPERGQDRGQIPP